MLRWDVRPGEDVFNKRRQDIKNHFYPPKVIIIYILFFINHILFSVKLSYHPPGLSGEVSFRWDAIWEHSQIGSFERSEKHFIWLMQQMASHLRTRVLHPPFWFSSESSMINWCFQHGGQLSKARGIMGILQNTWCCQRLLQLVARFFSYLIYVMDGYRQYYGYRE